YDLHQSTEDPSIFMLYENWKSKKELDEHLAMPYLKELLAKADDLLAKPIDINLYRMISEKA
ncbi:MAG: antibiotic biosynthesis monooxygenase, partial [Desulfosarcinaceae bacterium]